MILGYMPRVIIEFLIMFTGTPGEYGEQSKQKTLGPVGYMCTSTDTFA